MGIDVTANGSAAQGTNLQSKGISSLNLQVNHINGEIKPVTSNNEERIYNPFNKKQLNNLVSEANTLIKPAVPQLHYVLHEKLKQYYIRLEDPVTNQVIREIPPKKFMDMYAAIAEKLGLIVNKRV
ncbi:flagellar protein FlaG [Sporolactobacillus terrae]|uniref:Flagellar biosynthesis protein FlaG n=1 Tax=Sporolactobacillus terrae TaxID=269673 RepID=A0A410D7A9_9BACL|nr:flagellar protein FlaG [Sporolactobacillus terrae]QAA21965.1 flagellar biosynthesis protein FlaG [Sporolactobacillus terrae]QAA24938.1 flagellar biosynthesis protein FlaG [Sporolactobacillus terrae]BBN98242.1 hypothetical protein St703_09470 [Sporolactobacillus terrae]